MKKIISCLLVFAVILTIPAAAYYADVKDVPPSVSVTAAAFDITLNGQKFDNLNAKYPFIVYNDITYMPMTWNITRFMGLKTKYDAWYHNDASNPAFSMFFVGASGQRSDELMTDAAVTPFGADETAEVAFYRVAVEKYYAVYTGGEDYPVLNFRDVTYIPLTWEYARERFGWDYSFDAENGLVLDSRNAYRPVFNEEDMFSNGMNDFGINYVYNDDCYLGYCLSFSYHEIRIGRRGQDEIIIERPQLWARDEVINEVTTEHPRAFIKGVFPLRYWKTSHVDMEPYFDGKIFSTAILTEYNEIYNIKVDVDTLEILSCEYLGTY